jgi:hypothetical protein
MTLSAVELSESLQDLVDSRLDTIDRLLLRRIPRRDRLAIVREVDARVFELLRGRGTDEPTRDDVLGVLAQRDPPEANLPAQSDSETEPSVPRTVTHSSAVHGAKKAEPRAARAAGILGIAATALVLLSPLLSRPINGLVESVNLAAGAAPWTQDAGYLHDEPMFQAWREAMKEYRRKLDDDPEAL